MQLFNEINSNQKAIFSQLLRLGVILIFCMISMQLTAQKRGLAYGYHSPEDLEVMSPEISWWYNWYVAPENAVADVFPDYGFDFVPMTWNASFDENKLRQFLDQHPETKYLLAFNEPNFKDQANMTPSQIAAQWPRLESIANDYDLEIVGPAVNFCGNCVQENGVVYTDPVEYLDDFFAACPGCKVDHIAIHSYMNNIGALSWYVGLFKKYNKPIWLTEFAGWEQNGTINNINDQINFMIGAVDYLEADTSVFMYSWFIGRGQGINNYPYIDLLGDNGELTQLGEVYKNMPVHDLNNVVEIPSTIEAEAYNKMQGVLLEKTKDVSGFANVGYFDPGDWLEYKILVPQSKVYDLGFRFASTKVAGLKMLVDGTEKLSLTIPNYNGWQNWNTLQSQVYLEAGTHTIKLLAVTSGFNLNWFRIDYLAGTEGTLVGISDPVIIFPNPTRSGISIQTDLPVEKIIVRNVLGNNILTKSFSKSIEIENLVPGMYFLTVTDDKNSFQITRKFHVLD